MRMRDSPRRQIDYGLQSQEEQHSYETKVAEKNEIVRRRNITITSEASEWASKNSIIRENCVFPEERKNASPLIRMRTNVPTVVGHDDPGNCLKLTYRVKRRLIAMGVVLIAGIIAIIIASTFINNRASSHFSSTLGGNDWQRDRGLVPPDPETPQPPSWSKLRSFKRGAVCADGPPCAEIGKSMLDRNGSAVDAALAALICNGLINMQSMGIGGGFMMSLYERSSGQAYFLNAREVAPLGSTYDMYENKSATASRIGGLAIGVPGEIAGYWEAHRRFGKLSWRELFSPSIKLCREGYNLTKPQYDGLLVHPPNIRDDPTLREMFVNDPDTRQFKKPGSMIMPKKLCETMQLIADNGASILYNGSLGETLIEDLNKRGSILTMEDLNNYRALWSEPVRTNLTNGLNLISTGLPSSGPLLVFVLNVLENFNFNAESLANENETIRTHHRIIETWKYAYAMRTHLGDDNYVNVSEIIDKLLSKDYARSIWNAIRDDRTWNEPEHYGATETGVEDHGTAHIAVLAPNGDAVSVTSSVNFYFGSGIVSESTGILMNSAMDDFGTASNVNYFGIPASKNNYIEPGKRSLSSMVPSIIVQENGDVRMVVGGAGGTKITTSISYVIARHLWMKNSIKEAIDSARIHHQIFPMEISYEYGVTKQVLDGLVKLGHRISRYKNRGSVVCALVQLNGTIYANADYRKDGDVYGID